MLLTVNLGFGQQTHRIDDQLTKCLQDSLTTAGMANCEWATYQAWDQQLNTYYQLLLRGLKRENQELLREAQRQWISYRDKEFELIDAYYYSEKEGTMWIPVAAGEKAGIVKTRALQLQSYYEGLQEMRE